MITNLIADSASRFLSSTNPYQRANLIGAASSFAHSQVPYASGNTHNLINAVRGLATAASSFYSSNPSPRYYKDYSNQFLSAYLFANRGVNRYNRYRNYRRFKKRLRTRIPRRRSY